MVFMIAACVLDYISKLPIDKTFWRLVFAPKNQNSSTVSIESINHFTTKKKRTKFFSKLQRHFVIKLMAVY